MSDSPSQEEDSGRLLQAKREVEECFANQKWDLVSRVMSKKGGDPYPGGALKLHYKKLMLSAGAVPPPLVQDDDFEGFEDEAEGTVDGEAGTDADDIMED